MIVYLVQKSGATLKGHIKFLTYNLKLILCDYVSLVVYLMLQKIIIVVLDSPDIDECLRLYLITL